MNKLFFIIQSITNPKKVGAIFPSSGFLGDRMVEGVNFQKAKVIVEYGPGTGVFTEKLLINRNPQTKVMLVENNKEFYLLLKEKFKREKNLFIVHGSAENIGKYLKEYHLPNPDYVISGLPFTSLPKEISQGILLNTCKILSKDGQFITFQYTKLKKAFIEQFFTKVEVKRELRNLPPAYILSCSVDKQMEEYDGIKSTYCG
ncbi:rRNA adenine N-6-methyltransferase family protein [Bacillus sp. 31A1R]|uniref:rRNA adenine N-6-methyltransferase family protein n=1 Tax=Robertmurraya mangrovi TaxID=3098077 RepID=A0ABU5IWB6_9BACI|nr:rRNA adenine N-6-methyltransferase family protein [Bacillus sp. 31A1R]MDZ5471452.1 rRNA adenine N-6-methyltransferase family protein [Bacillus sp. 31A1R]